MRLDPSARCSSISTTEPKLIGDKTAARIKELADIGITADILKAGVEALRAHEALDPLQVKTSVTDETVPPPEALPLLAAICQSNYRNNVTYLHEMLKP